MAWEHLSITTPHLVYLILGGFTSLFMLCSSVIKERMYIGEATVATICGVIFGPHAANLIDPRDWGNVDEITLEFSRIVLVVQCFAVGVELPKYYMERHWRSVTFLLVPVMASGWLITSIIVYWMVPSLTYVECLVIAACVTATDPVLASSVVGKGKFAKRVPKHLRDLLSAESGCNDGMAFPFVYLGIYLIHEHMDPGQTIYHWICFTVLYECVFGAFYGFVIGYIARHAIKYAEEHDLIDRESFLVFYFTLALFCAGSGSLLGMDDLLIGFACGVGFSNDGWFHEKTEESHVSNVIDLLINLAYFVFLGTIIPWEMYNDYTIGLSAWRLSVLAIFVLLFRRIPIMMALKPIIPDLKTWREALFAGHFGPIGVGAIFVAILARAELETSETIPEDHLPTAEENKHYQAILLVWPIVTFMVIASILVHGSSIAVFTLGKRINTLQLSVSYTVSPDDGPSWMNRLPRISSQSKSQARTMSDTDYDEYKMPDFPPGTLPPTGFPGQFLRRQKEEDEPSRTGSRASSLVSRRRSRKRWDDGIGPGGPVTQSAIFPSRRSESEPMSPDAFDEKERYSPDDSETPPSERAREKEPEKAEPETEPRHEHPREVQVYEEGHNLVIEDQDGQVLAVDEEHGQRDQEGHIHPTEIQEKAKEETQKPGWNYDTLKRSIGKWRDEEVSKRKEKTTKERKHEPARAFQFGNTIIVEDEDGEVIRQFELPAEDNEEHRDYIATSLKYMGLGGLVKPGAKPPAGDAKKGAAGSGAQPSSSKMSGPARTFSGWGGFGGRGDAGKKAQDNPAANPAEDNDEDRQLRFTIGAAGRRMTKDDFLKEVQGLAPSKTRPTAGPAAAGGPASRVAALKSSPATSSSPQRNPNVMVTAPSSSLPSASASPKSKSPAPGPKQPAPVTRGRSNTKDSVDAPSHEEPETAAEKRRRLAAFASVREDKDIDENETPAERRRREAALGMGVAGSSGVAEESDSDDDNTERVPPAARRGIRFADPSPKNRG